MGHAEYFVLLLAGWVSLVFADVRYAGVWRCWRRLLAVEAVTLTIFLGWDSLGVHRGYWRSDPRRVLGVWPLPGVPIEEFVLLSMVAYAAIVLWRIARSMPLPREGEVRRP